MTDNLKRIQNFTFITDSCNKSTQTKYTDINTRSDSNKQFFELFNKSQYNDDPDFEKNTFLYCIKAEADVLDDIRAQDSGERKTCNCIKSNSKCKSYNCPSTIPRGPGASVQVPLFSTPTFPNTFPQPLYPTGENEARNCPCNRTYTPSESSGGTRNKALVIRSEIFNI